MSEENKCTLVTDLERVHEPAARRRDKMFELQKKKNAPGFNLDPNIPSHRTCVQANSLTSAVPDLRKAARQLADIPNQPATAAGNSTTSYEEALLRQPCN
jgi:hypothetical protein